MFKEMAEIEASELHIKHDPQTGLHAIIAIHSTALGPGLGGCRCVKYPNESAAIYDVLRLARAMSYKAAMAQLPMGGAKAVLMKPEKIENRPAYFESFGNFIESLNGRYITAVDSGTSVEDMDNISQRTRYVTSTSAAAGDPSPYTAQGVYNGLLAAIKHKLKTDQCKGIHVAIQGIGHVGYHLAKMLAEAGAELTLTDVNAALLEQCKKEFKTKIVAPEDIYSVKCDVFAPCALGGVINDETIAKLQCQIVAGAANNQLARDKHGLQLHERGILYAPDYIINAGGLICVAVRYNQQEEKIIHNKIDIIGTTLSQLFTRATKENKPPSQLADIMAKEKISG